MKNNTAILEETLFREYLAGFVPLSLWFAWTTSIKHNEPLSRIIARKTNLYRNSIFDDCSIPPQNSLEDPRWAKVLDALGDLFTHSQKNTDASAFERAATEHLWPYIEPAIGESIRRHRRVAEQTRHECWRFDINADTANIHIANVYRPESPLGSRFADFRRSLFEMLHFIRETHPKVRNVHCGSWMNGIPRFYGMFPPEWKANGRVVTDIGPGLGQWGQFMNRKGGFHACNGNHFRETGDMPFSCIECSAGLDAILARGNA